MKATKNEMVLIESNNGFAQLIYYCYPNYYRTINTEIIYKDNRCCVCGKEWNQLLQSLNGVKIEKLQFKEPVLSVFIDQDTVISVTANFSEFVKEDFDNCSSVEVSATELEYIKNMSSFCSKDNTRLFLTGIYFGNNGDIVATDGRRMAWFNSENIKLNDIILHSEGFQFCKGPVTFIINEKGHCFIPQFNLVLFSITDTRFVNYNSVIPKQETLTKKANIDLKPFTKQFSAFKSKSENNRCIFTGNKVFNFNKIPQITLNTDILDDIDIDCLYLSDTNKLFDKTPVICFCQEDKTKAVMFTNGKVNVLIMPLSKV